MNGGMCAGALRRVALTTLLALVLASATLVAGASETRLRGVISAIDRNAEPLTVTLTQRGTPRTISINSDARVYLEDVTANARTLGRFDDLQVGDALLVVLASDGKVIELHDFFRSATGVVRAASPSALVLAGGAVIEPSGTTLITVNGAPAKLEELQAGDAIAVRRNPETGEVRQIIAARKVAATPPPASTVRIEAFSISANRPLRAGESFEVRLDGTPGGKATFDIGNFVTDNPMGEQSPGVYRARFTVPERFNVTQASVYGHLSVAGTEASRAEAPTPFSAATTPPAILEIAPPAGQSVNTSRPNIYATFLSPSDVGIDPSSIRIVVNGHDVTAAATRSANFVTYSPGVDFPDGSVTVTVRVADAAGNGSSRSWSFTIKTP